MVTASTSWLDLALFVGLHLLAAGVMAAVFGVLLVGRSERNEA